MTKKRKHVSEEKSEAEVEQSTESSEKAETPIAKVNHKINLGTLGVFELKEGEPIPEGIPTKFHGSLEREGII